MQQSVDPSKKQLQIPTLQLAGIPKIVTENWKSDTTIHTEKGLQPLLRQEHKQKPL